MLAIIGGSGLARFPGLEALERRRVPTAYGDPSGALNLGLVCGRPVVFLARHGDEHTIAPHRVNYRANLWALRECGATAILAVAAVGCIRADLRPGDLVIPHQIIDYTWGRQSTYHEDTDSAVRHIDFTDPYDPLLRRQLGEAAAALGTPLSDAAVYAATQGPRLETAAEINRLEGDGAEVVGMTGMPEAALARELGLPYAAINVVANHAAGRGDNRVIDMAAIDAVLAGAMQQVCAIIERILTNND